jgi:hypothetical protein
MYGFPLSWDGDGAGGPQDCVINLMGRKRDNSFTAYARFADIMVKKFGNP